MKCRIAAARLMVVSVIGGTLITRHVYQDGSSTQYLFEVAGLSLLAVAALGRIWASAYISGRKNLRLTTSGPYAMVRNPLYFFSFLAFLGAGLAFGSVVLSTLLCLIFFLTHWPSILREECELRRRFGSAYEQYRKLVPRFIPDPRLLRPPVAVPVISPAFSRAALDSSLILLLFPLARSITWAHMHSLLPGIFQLY